MTRAATLIPVLLVITIGGARADESQGEKDADVVAIGAHQEAENLQAQINDLKAQIAVLQQQHPVHHYSESEIQDIKNMDAFNACSDKCFALCKTHYCEDDPVNTRDTVSKCGMKCNETYQESKTPKSNQHNLPDLNKGPNTQSIMYKDK